MTRKPERNHYDAQVGLDPSGSHLPSFAYALVKFTYAIENGATVLTEPEPLLYDIWSNPDLPKFQVGSDYWFDKPATDVVVRGYAMAVDGRPFQSSSVSVRVADRVKRIAVFGQRVVEWSKNGTASFSAPEPVDKVPLLYQLAYGGFDPRVPIPAEQAEDYQRLLEEGQAYDHPGLYPRNPVGKGYIALPGPVEGLELPNLEDPSDLLRPERLCAGAPELWYRQPLPYCFEPMVGLTFPRVRYMGMEPWYPAPHGADLPEVARGFCPPNLPASLAQNESLAITFLQEASLGMAFATPLAGQPVEVQGMHPEMRSLNFVVPPPPRLEMVVEGQRQPVEARLTNLTLLPHEKRFSVTYAAKTPGLSRAFIPGIHRVIPIAVIVNGDAEVRYETPVPIRDRLNQGAPAA
jgi:hypothetical protein